MYEPTIKAEVRKLRKEGYTFREIREKLPFLAKGTVSEWTRDIILTPEQQKRILQEWLKGRIKLIRYNKWRHLDSVKKAQKIISEVKQEIGKITKRDLLIAGTALYWAEGSIKSRNEIEVANSDPKIIVLLMRFFREILQIEERKFRGGLFLHPGLDKNATLKFWSSLTKIPSNQFNKVYIKPPKSSTGKMHNILYKGTLKIRICDTKKLWRIKGFIEVLGNKKLAPSSRG